MAALLAAGGLSKEAGTEVEIRHTDSRQRRLPGPPPPMAGGPHGAASQAAYQQPLPAARSRPSSRWILTAATAGAVKVPELPRRRRGPRRQAHAAADLRDRTGTRSRASSPIRPTRKCACWTPWPWPAAVSNPVAEDVLVIRQLPGAQGAGPHRRQHPGREERAGQPGPGARRHRLGGTDGRDGRRGRDPDVLPLQLRRQHDVVLSVPRRDRHAPHQRALDVACCRSSTAAWPA